MNKQDLLLTIDEYHAHPAVSRSVLSKAGRAKTAAHFHVAMSDIKKSDALRFGNAFHKMLLEPELYKKFAIDWQDTVSTTTQKFIKTEEALEAGYFLVPAAWNEQMKEMANAIKAHPRAAKLLGLNGVVEPSYFWRDEMFGVDCKCRPDFFADNFVIDLKKTENSFKSASEEDFWRHVTDFDYDVQVYMNLEGIERVTGKRPDGFLFIVVEDSAPYGTNVFVAGESVIMSGRTKYERHMQKYNEYKNSTECYSKDIKTLELPEWYMNKLLNIS